MGFEQNLTSEVIMAHDALPNFVSVKYTSNCPGGEKPSDRGKCDNVNIGQDVSTIRHQHTQPKDRQIINASADANLYLSVQQIKQMQ